MIKVTCVKSFLENNKEETLRRMTNKIADIPKFEILKSQYYDTLWTKNYNSRFLMYISKEDINALDFCVGKNDFINIMEKNITKYNSFMINSRLEIIKADLFNGDLYNECKNLSNGDYCGAFFGENGVVVFEENEVIMQDSLFFKSKDLIQFNNRKSITEIHEVIELYRKQYLQDYCGELFESNSKIAKINDEWKQRNILINKPENKMREHLAGFLNKNLRCTFNVNINMPKTEKMFDICTESDGNFYFFIIEWLGRSIDDFGTSITTLKSDYEARKAISKTLEYLKHLDAIKECNVIDKVRSEEKTSSEYGYLVIYDARDGYNTINYEEYRFVDIELKQYLDKFRVFDNLKIDRKNIA